MNYKIFLHPFFKHIFSRKCNRVIVCYSETNTKEILGKKTIPGFYFSITHSVYIINNKPAPTIYSLTNTMWKPGTDLEWAGGCPIS
jgi:hypothetical protein